jgi:phosphonate transport system substrate-binding protein
MTIGEEYTMKLAAIARLRSRLGCLSATALLSFALAALALTDAARADWRQDLGTFRIGISATDAKPLSAEETEKLRSGYEAALNMPVEIVVLRDYPALIDAQVSSRIEYAIYTSASYAAAWLLCECVEPLAAPVQTNGATGIRSVLVMNAGAIFTRLDLNGIKIGIPGRDSVSGLAVPLAEYTIGSRVLTADERFFNKFSGMDETAAAFADGRIDGFFGWVFSDAAGPLKGSGLMRTGVDGSLAAGGKTVEIKIPWTSSLLRFGPHAVRRNLDAEAKSALRNYLQGLNDEQIDLLSLFPPHDIAKFVAVTQEEYRSSVAAAKAAAGAAD